MKPFWIASTVSPRMHSLLPRSDVFSLGRGLHLYDFTVEIPKNAPATFKLDAWASVRYTISAYLQVRSPTHPFPRGHSISVLQLAGKTAAESDYSEPVEVVVVGQSKEVLAERLKRAEPQQGTSVYVRFVVLCPRCCHSAYAEPKLAFRRPTL